MERLQQKFKPHPPLLSGFAPEVPEKAQLEGQVASQRPKPISVVPRALALAAKISTNPFDTNVKKRVVPRAIPLKPNPIKASFRNDEEKAKYEEECYEKTLIFLEKIQTDPRLVPTLIEPMRKLLHKIKELKLTAKVPTKVLTDVMVKTEIRLRRPDELSHKTYHSIANSMQGHPSTNLQILGALMLGLGIAMAIVGGMFFLPLIPTAAIALAGIGLFAYQRKPHGLAKAMMELNPIDGSGAIFAR
jgi:hypothetical protein